MDFTAFDQSKLEEYARRAKAEWGETEAYCEYERKSEGRPDEETGELNRQMMQIFAEIGAVKNEDPASERAQALIRKLRDFITEHYYTCSDQVLLGLGQMYAAGGEMTDNIDRYGGEGTGAFTNAAIQAFCRK